MNSPLKGLRVLDLTRVLAGPYCTQMLGDLGAEIIKVERPGAGDDTRGFAPPYLKDDNGNETDLSAYYCGANRNKRSITINLSEKEGQDIIRKLLKNSDILVENFKTGTLAKYGLSYDDLKNEFPRLIFCSITGFGQTGPYASRPGYDGLIQAMGGVMALTGEPNGEPMKVGVPIGDLMAGMFASVGILAAVKHQTETGKGQFIDIGMLDTHVAWLANQGMNYLSTDENPERLGNQHPNIVPYQVMPTSDGYIVLSIGNDNDHSVALWETNSGTWEDGTLLTTARGDKSPVLWAAFTPADSGTLFVSGGVRHIRFWALSGRSLKSKLGSGKKKLNTQIY